MWDQRCLPKWGFVLWSRWLTAWRLSKPLTFWDAFFYGFAVFLIGLAVKATRDGLDSGDVAEAFGTACGVLLVWFAGLVIARLQPGKNEALQWRFRPSWSRFWHGFSSMVGIGCCMMWALIVGGVLSIFLDFQTAMKSAGALTALGLVFQAVVNGMIEERTIEAKEPIAPSDAQKSGLPHS